MYDMEKVNTKHNSRGTKKKFLKAFAVHNEGSQDICAHQALESKTEEQEWSCKMEDTCKDMGGNNVETLTAHNTIPIKLQLIRSKDPLGVGRFGVVYMASILDVKLHKKNVNILPSSSNGPTTDTMVKYCSHITQSFFLHITFLISLLVPKVYFMTDVKEKWLRNMQAIH